MDEATKYLFTQGILGICCFFLGVAYYRVYLALISSYKDRVTDQGVIIREVVTAVQEVTRAVDKLSEYLKAKG